MSFPCTKCGACCRFSVKLFKDLSRYPEDHPFHFPYKEKDGACEMLIDNKCSVYERRPRICSIDEMNRTFGLPDGSRYDKIIARCNKMMDDENLPKELRIPTAI